MLTRRPSIRDDAGFTLMEVIITVAIMGIIITGLTGTVISYLRTTTDTQTRMTESQDLQFATAYWQRDVSSIGLRDNTYNSDDSVHSFALRRSVNVAPCAVPGGSTPVITLAWSEQTSLESESAPETVKVTYASRPRSGRFELIRVRCGTNPSQNVVADNLASVPTVTCTGGAVSGCDDNTGKVPTKIAMLLSISDSEGTGNTAFSTTIAGERRQT